MARKVRAEVEGGLYHVMTRGNNRRRIFNCSFDYEKFLTLLATQKRKLPFFLYAYCLMPNHVHLAIERQSDAIGCIMQRVLTGYSQYYNRRYRRSGHLLQGRYKATLCQSDRYLAELVRYIHLNPVRAKMVGRPEQYKYSSHRAYLGLEPPGVLDVDPVLRHFGTRKESARDAYRSFVAAGMGAGYEESFSVTGREIVGSEDFIDATIHQIGKTTQTAKAAGPDRPFDGKRLIAAVEKVCDVRRQDFLSCRKNSRVVLAKEILIVCGVQLGATLNVLGEITGLSSGSLSRRHDAARMKLRENSKISKLISGVKVEYKKSKI